MKEEDVFNTVQEPTPVEQPVAPVQPTETVQPVEQFQTPVEPQPVQQINQDVNFNPMPPKKSPAKTILILLLTAIIIGGATYGGYQYYSSTVENKTKGNDVTETTTTTEETTTTTTTEKKEVKLLDFKTIDDYYLYVNRSGRISGNERIAILSVDNTFYDIKYDLNNRCKKDGDVVKYTIEKSNVEYTCKIDKACYENNNCSLDDPEWTADVTVNEKYKIQKETMTTCVSWANYTNGKYHLNFLHGCGQGGYYIHICHQIKLYYFQIQS